MRSCARYLDHWKKWLNKDPLNWATMKLVCSRRRTQISFTSLLHVLHWYSTRTLKQCTDQALVDVKWLEERVTRTVLCHNAISNSGPTQHTELVLSSPKGTWWRGGRGWQPSYGQGSSGEYITSQLSKSHWCCCSWYSRRDWRDNPLH